MITGANTGFGRQIVKAPASSSNAYDTAVAGRSLDKVQAAFDSAKDEFSSTQSKFHPLQVDIESDESINAAFGIVQSQFSCVDVSINNASLECQRKIITHTFVPLLLRSTNPRLLFLTSGTSTLGGAEHALADKPAAKGWPKQGMSVAAYRNSKTGMNMMMREWHRLLQAGGVKVWCISPGSLATNIGDAEPGILKKMGASDPEVFGPFILSVLQGVRDADVGKVITKDGVQAW